VRGVFEAPREWRELPEVFLAEERGHFTLRVDRIDL
jgi:hypothetical protein